MQADDAQRPRGAHRRRLALPADQQSRWLRVDHCQGWRSAQSVRKNETTWCVGFCKHGPLCDARFAPFWARLRWRTELAGQLGRPIWLASASIHSLGQSLAPLARGPLEVVLRLCLWIPCAQARREWHYLVCPSQALAEEALTCVRGLSCRGTYEAWSWRRLPSPPVSIGDGGGAGREFSQQDLSGFAQTRSVCVDSVTVVSRVAWR